MKLCDLKDCTGCLACVNICNNNALTITTDDKGFYIPHLIDDKCNNCHLCENVCPVSNVIKKVEFKQTGYASWSKSESVRRISSSGGLFSELANYILNNNGIVCGAIFDKDFTVNHTCINSLDDF